MNLQSNHLIEGDEAIKEIEKMLDRNVKNAELKKLAALQFRQKVLHNHMIPDLANIVSEYLRN